ncbi:MAG: nitrate reductase subunit beta [Rickettsiaceae bacterium]|nr:nitrate reductase subunit beta [Rickettsiaceae bacterium]
MKVRAQIVMVLNLDKCIGCHTCSVTCKNVWTSRPGMEYAWFNNVETKPGIGFPANWEDQYKYNGGWELKSNGKLVPKMGGKLKILSKIFSNPDMPQIDDYYEPFTYDYSYLQSAPESKHIPSARPVSILTGKTMATIVSGPNWEELMGGEFYKRSQDKNFDDIQKEIYGEFENSFMMYLPRLCEHCLNPACSAVCPSGAIYKREEDGIVLIDQDKCRGWRMCVSGCPYKKIYYNWKSGKSEKCTFCYPRVESGMPTVCSETCVGRIRYLGVMLYDSDQIEKAASVTDTEDLYQSQLDIFLDPNDPEVIAAAKENNIADNWLDAAKKSPIYKLISEWKIAFPLHPEYRTLPMVWYIPPLSPIQDNADAGNIGINGMIPDVRSLRIPVKYLANLLTAGKEEPVVLALEKMLAMRAFMRSVTVEKKPDESIAEHINMTVEQIEEMYRYLALAHYDDRYVIPTAHKELIDDPFGKRSGCGFNTGPYGDVLNTEGVNGRKNLFGGD